MAGFGLIGTVCVYSVVVYIHVQIAEWTFQRAKLAGVNNLPRLPDIIYDSHYIRQFNEICKWNHFTFVPDCILLVWIIASFTACWWWRINVIPPLLHFISCHTIALIMRACCIGATILPTPSTIHRHQITHSNSFLNTYINNILGSNDLIFSGHTTLFVLLAGTWSKYILASYTTITATWCLCVTGSFLLVLAEHHYSVDVLVAIFLITQLYFNSWLEVLVDYLIHD